MDSSIKKKFFAIKNKRRIQMLKKERRLKLINGLTKEEIDKKRKIHDNCIENQKKQKYKDFVNYLSKHKNNPPKKIPRHYRMFKDSKIYEDFLSYIGFFLIKKDFLHTTYRDLDDLQNNYFASESDKENIAITRLQIDYIIREDIKSFLLSLLQNNVFL